jgi:hypothetical protein
VTVVMDGRPRLTSVRIAARGENPGPGQLAASVTRTVNRAMDQVRQGRGEMLVAASSPDLEPWLRGAFDSAADPGSRGSQDPGGRKSGRG